MRASVILVAAPVFERQLDVASAAGVHDNDVPLARGIAASPGESQELPVGVPAGICGFARAVGEEFDIRAVGVHRVNLLAARSAGNERDLRAGFRVHLGFGIDGVA